MKKPQQTLFWYDLETFGINPQTDRIAQFAGVRTDMDLNPIEDPVVLYCRITPDFLPDPLSCLVTGITPQMTLKSGISENEFITLINEEFSRPGTCVAGYNNIRFDDEFIRNALYRNLMDPYQREYAGGNSRWDIINLMRMTHDLRPDGIEWPKDENDRTSFRLEKLTQANSLSHENAHDALSDVYATIAMADLVKNRQGKLYDFLFKIRRKQELAPYMDIHERTPFLLTAPYLWTPLGSTSLVSPVGIDVKLRNKIYCLDLREDPTPFIELSIEELKKRIFTRREVLEEEGIKPLSIIPLYMNRVPAIAPASVLSDEDAQRIGIDKEICRKHYKMIKSHPELSVKLIQLFNQDFSSSEGEPEDPDLMIYRGDFFIDADRDRMKGIRMLPPENVLNSEYRFDDPRLPEMVWRFVCRNHPTVLGEKELMRWKSFCASRLLVPPGNRKSDFNFYMRKVNEKMNDKDVSASDKRVLKELYRYGVRMGEKVLDLKFGS